MKKPKRLIILTSRFSDVPFYTSIFKSIPLDSQIIIFGSVKFSVLKKLLRFVRTFFRTLFLILEERKIYSLPWFYFESDVLRVHGFECISRMDGQKIFKDSIVISLGSPKIPSDILSLIWFGINVHTGLLPAYKGVRSIELALKNNDFGSLCYTIHLLSPKVDAGAIVGGQFGPRVFLKSFVQIKLWYLLNSLREIEQIVSANVSSKEEIESIDQTSGGRFYSKSEADFLLGSNRNYLITDAYKKFHRKGKENRFVDQFRSINGLVILCYHSFVSRDEAETLQRFNFPRIYTDTNIFYQHMEVMSDVGQILDFEEGIKRYLRGELDTGCYFVVSFDDGFESALKVKDCMPVEPCFFLNGRPILEGQSTKFWRSLISKYRESMERNEELSIVLENLKFFSKNELVAREKLNGSLLTVGSHTYDHFDLNSRNISFLREQIIEDNRKLSRSLNRRINYFSFPFGKLERRSVVSDAIVRNEFSMSFGCFGGVNRGMVNNHEFLRIGIHNESKSDFTKLLSVQWERG